MASLRRFPFIAITGLCNRRFYGMIIRAVLRIVKRFRKTSDCVIPTMSRLALYLANYVEVGLISPPRAVS
jgi:hypothetical protein